MTAGWPGFVIPLAACAATLLAAWLTGMVLGNAETTGAISTVALVVVLPIPLFVAAMWGAALMFGRPWYVAVPAAVAWYAASWLLVPHEIVWQLLGHVVAGLLGGFAWMSRWRFDAALLTVALALTPLVVWSAAEAPMQEQLQVYGDEMVKALESKLPTNADVDQRVQAMAAEKEKMDRIVAIVVKVFPSLLALGVLGQAAIVLAILRLVIRARGWRGSPWHLPPFSRWQVPFYLVWLLVVGLGLLLTRQPGWANAGLNVVILSAAILSVQGMAVQFFVTGRGMSRLVRAIYWTVMGTFFAPLVIVSSVVVGLIDQWWDIRRLDQVSPG